MYRGRGGAVFATTIMLCLVVLFHFVVAESASYVVRGGGSWTFNVSGWPEGKKFKAGDTLILDNTICEQNLIFSITSSSALQSNNTKYAISALNWTRLYIYMTSSAVFNYNPTIHNVVVVNEGGYQGCTTPSGAKVYKTGKDQIKLVKGQNFFICNFPGHCQSGMKIAITAM